MPKFFFNLRDGDSYLRDVDGDNCPTLEEAANRGVARVARLLNEPDTLLGSFRQIALEITDEHQRLRLRIPFPVAIEISRA